MSALFGTLLIEAGAGLAIASSLAVYAQRHWALPRSEAPDPRD